MSVRFWRSAGHFEASISREICTVPSLYRPSSATDGVMREYIKWRCISPGNCLCACAFQQRTRDRELRIVSCPGGGVWVAVTREFERDNCVTSEILQSSQIELACQENRLKFPD